MSKKETHGIWKGKKVWKGLNAIESNHQEKECREELQLSEY